MAKSKKNWKTKEIDGRPYMICQNSDLEFSKYPDWSPDHGESKCKEWTEVVKETTAVLCSECTRRSLQL